MHLLFDLDGPLTDPAVGITRLGQHAMRALHRAPWIMGGCLLGHVAGFERRRKLSQGEVLMRVMLAVVSERGFKKEAKKRPTPGKSGRDGAAILNSNS